MNLNPSQRHNNMKSLDSGNCKWNETKENVQIIIAEAALKWNNNFKPNLMVQKYFGL